MGFQVSSVDNQLGYVPVLGSAVGLARCTWGAFEVVYYGSKGGLEALYNKFEYGFFEVGYNNSQGIKDGAWDLLRGLTELIPIIGGATMAIYDTKKEADHWRGRYWQLNNAQGNNIDALNSRFFQTRANNLATQNQILSTQIRTLQTELENLRQAQGAQNPVTVGEFPPAVAVVVPELDENPSEIPPPYSEDSRLSQ